MKPVKLLSQKLPTFLLFRDRQSVAKQQWIRLHSSSNIVGATHTNYTWSTKSYGLYPPYDALQVPTLLGVVASVCTPLPTRTQLIFQPQSQVSHANGTYLSQIREMGALVVYHLHVQTCEFHSGIVFTICTNQFLLPKNGCESLKLVSLVSAFN